MRQKVPERIRKTIRFSDETQKMLNELKEHYKVYSENALLEIIIKEIWEQKQSKALVPYEELDKKDQELKKLYYELGKLQSQLEQKQKELEEKQKELEQKQKEKHRSFFAKIFGR